MQATRTASAHAPKDWRLPLWCGVVFPAIGLLAIPFPQLLGNGKGLAQTGFDSELGLPLAAALLLLRLVVTLGALRAGAKGGLLTRRLAPCSESFSAAYGIMRGRVWPSELRNYRWCSIFGVIHEDAAHGDRSHF